MGESEPLAERAPMARGRYWAALILGALGLAVLVNLGLWQVDRLAWKEAIVARIDSRIHAQPIDLARAIAIADETGDIDYMPVSARGRFLHGGERYYLSTREGEAGWNVYTPLVVEGAQAAIMVNRGFVPYARRDPATRAEGQVAGEVDLVGLAREAPAEKPASFLPDNDPAGNNFYWRGLADMSAGLDLPEGVRLLPFFLDAGPGEAPGGYPVGGATVVDISNNHLQYAITWFALAVILAGMLAILIVSQARRRA
ncbi:SURF1 family protein [Aureimonas populi]|uniref:SURF1-like protein n=1 Tax=Aureimonas populi TaxID=1701758 RepID=A0ABW5CMP7_9HYPH|nr:SURF1 family protein [Aureimonas populi]